MATPAPPIPPEPPSPGSPPQSPKFEVIPGRKQPKDWREESLTVTKGELLSFQERLRAAVSRLAHLIENQQLCFDLFGDLDKRLHAYLSRFPERDWSHDENPDAAHTTRIMFRLARLLPDEDGWDFLNEFIDLGDAHEEEAERPHFVLRRGSPEKGYQSAGEEHPKRRGNT